MIAGAPLASALLTAALFASCRGDAGRPAEASAADARPSGPATAAGEFLPPVSPDWVESYVPERSAGGYNLILHQRRTPVLIDMNGEPVHAWPQVRASGRAKLLPTGHLAALTDDGRFEEYDWEGRATWTFRPVRRHLLHHDFARLRNGNYLLVVQVLGTRGFDYLVEIDRSGREVWRWESRGHLAEDFRKAGVGKSHINSVQELPPNQWFDRGHEGFRPGNVLVSARNINTVLVVARPGGEVVWRYEDGLDHQHEALMTPPGRPGAGRVLVFDNGYRNLHRYRRSAVVEIDPVGRAATWRYDSPHFFSSTGGAQQAMPNGNVLVTSSLGGRAFEVTRKGRIVWQWTPPYDPMRVSRYPYDFCPQLDARGRPSERTVRRADPDSFIDADLYRFALDYEIERIGERRRKVPVLGASDGCRRLLVPEGAELSLAYGVDRQAFEGRRAVRQAHFAATVRASSGGRETRELLERVVGAAGPPDGQQLGPIVLRRETFSLESFARQTVELCLALVDDAATPGAEGFVWGLPSIRAGDRERGPDAEQAETAALPKHQAEQLQALGYVE